MKINNKKKLFYNTISFIFIIFLLAGCTNSNKNKTQSHIQQPDSNITNNNVPPNNISEIPKIEQSYNNTPPNNAPEMPKIEQPDNNIPPNNVSEKPQPSKEEKEKSENSEKKETNNYSSYKGKIKGNTNSKIYHFPGGAYYDKVSEKNAVYFDSVEEAENAGYRQAKR